MSEQVGGGRGGQERVKRPVGPDVGDEDTDDEVVRVDPGSTVDMERKLKEAADRLAKEKAREAAVIAARKKRRACCCC